MSTETAESIFTTVEPLHPDLSGALVTLSIGACIKHPLLYSVPHFAGLNAYVNRQYAQKLEAVEHAKMERDWRKFLLLHERAYRFPAFNEVMDQMADAEFWDLFGWCWTDTENLWQNWDVISPVLRSGRPGRENMMDDAEREALAALPEVVTIYRGHKRHNKSGFSWSLDRAKAEWFATRYKAKGARLTTASIRRENVIALLMGRGESEVVCFHEDTFQRTTANV